MSGTTTEERIDALAGQFARELFLWEDPFDAPGVPDEETLKNFYEDHFSVEPGLAEQIRTDINCRRALRRIESEKSGLREKGETFSEKEFSETFKSRQVSLKRLNIKRIYDAKPGKTLYLPSKGDIFNTRRKLLTFKDGRLSYIYTFKPCRILLLDNGRNMPWGDKVFKCAAVTSDKDCKALEGHDIDLKNGWILHKWLSCFVSSLQIDFTERVDADTVVKIDDIAESVEKYSVSDVKKMPFERDRQRLYAAAGYLSVMAKAKMEFAQWRENRFGQLDNELLAADDKKVSTIVVRSREEGKSKCFAALLDVKINISSENCKELENRMKLPTWTIDEKAPHISDGTVFVLKNIGTGKYIGFGTVNGGVAQLERIIPEALLQTVDNASQVVLEVFI